MTIDLRWARFMRAKQISLAIAKIIADLGLDKAIAVDSFEFKIIVQKIGYVLQKIGCDLGLRFGWFTLGPYSRSLQNYYSTIAETLADFKRKDIASEPGIELSEDLKACVDSVKSFLDEFKSTINDFNLKSLEILASLMMLCSEIYPKPENPVEELLKKKKNLDRNSVETIWRFLANKNICSG